MLIASIHKSKYHAYYVDNFFGVLISVLIQFCFCLIDTACPFKMYCVDLAWEFWSIYKKKKKTTEILKMQE